MRLYSGLIAIIFVFVGLTGPAKANDEHVFTLAGPDFPPYYYRDNQGRPAGNLVDLYAAVLKDAGYKWSAKIVPAKRVMFLMVQGHFDSSILVNNPILQESGLILTSRKPVSQMTLNAYHPEGQQIKSSNQLEGKKVIVMRGYGYGGLRRWLDIPDNNVTIFEVDSFASAIQMIEVGRADYALLYDVNFIAGKKELKRPSIGVASSTLSKVPLYFHLNVKTVPNAKNVMTKLMSSYDKLVRQGQLEPSSKRPEEIFTPGNKTIGPS